jgi:hypothetical protein
MVLQAGSRRDLDVSAAKAQEVLAGLAHQILPAHKPGQQRGAAAD